MAQNKTTSCTHRQNGCLVQRLCGQISYAVSLLLVLFNARVHAQSPPSLIFPTNGASGLMAKVQFIWHSSSGASSYTLKVASDPYLVGTGQSVTLPGADTTYQVSGLAPGTVYYWGVKAANYSTAPWSEIRQFTTYSPLLGEYEPDSETVLLLHLNEQAGSTLSDASNYGDNGTESGTTIVSGRFGNARQFNGSSDYISFGKSLTGKILNALSVEAWVKPDSSDTLGNKIFYDGGDGEFELDMYPGLAAGFHVNLSAGGWYAVYSKRLNAGQWYHLAGSYDGIDHVMKLYVNGELVADSLVPSSALLEPGVGSYLPTVGAYNRSGVYSLYFKGGIDELRVSNVARSPDDFDLQLPPTSLSASVAGTTAGLNWQNSGGSVPLMRYKIYRGLDSTNVIAIDSTTSTSYQNSGLTSGTTYYYRVSAVDSTGFESAWSYATKTIITGASASPPHVSSFSPASGPIGTSVTITGTNFNPTVSNNIVFFGAVKAAVTKSTFGANEMLPIALVFR